MSKCHKINHKCVSVLSDIFMRLCIMLSFDLHFIFAGISLETVSLEGITYRLYFSHLCFACRKGFRCFGVECKLFHVKFFNFRSTDHA